MFNKELSLSNMKDGLRRIVSFQSVNSRTIRRWVPRRPVLGVEVVGDSLTLACIKSGVGRAPLAYFGSIPEVAAMSPQEIGRKLQEFLQPLHGEEPVVVLGLPRQEVMVRFLTLPVAAKNSFAEAVALQVEMYKPTDGEPFDWDTCVVEQQGSLATTLLFAPHRVVEKYVTLFSDAGYPLTRIVPTQFSLLHVFLSARQESQTGRCLLLDAREDEAELALVEGKRLVYSRSLPLPRGSSTLVSELFRQIRQAYSSLRWKESDGQAVVVSGNLPEAVERGLASFGSLERLADKIKLPGLPEQPALHNYAGAAATALCHLSGNRRSYCLNLLPATMRPVRNQMRHLPTYTLLAANALLLLALGLRIPLQNYILLRQYRKEIAGLQMRAGEMKQLLHNGRTMRQELLALDAFQQHGRQPLDALNEVAQRLPPDVWLSSFSYKKGQVELNGSAKAASPLLPLFQSSLQFQDVKFNGALTHDASGAERFRLQMRLKEKR
jgi:Fimbrial assembly protein (PilN)